MHVLKAILLKLVSALLFAVMSALVRFLGEKYSVGQIVFFRSAFAILPVVIIYALRNELAAAVRTQRPLGHVGRGGISILGMFCNFSALARLPIVDATAISFASPLITVALAALLLKERVRIYRWSAVIVGFIGILVMLAPYFDPALHAETVASTVGLVFAISRSRVERGVRNSDAPSDPDGDHVVHRALFLADLRGCRSSDLALGVAACRRGANSRRWLPSAYAAALLTSFSPRATVSLQLAGGSVRLHVDGMGVSARLFFLSMSFRACSSSLPVPRSPWPKKKKLLRHAPPPSPIPSTCSRTEPPARLERDGSSRCKRGKRQAAHRPMVTSAANSPHVGTSHPKGQVGQPRRSARNRARWTTWSPSGSDGASELRTPHSTRLH